MRATIAICSRNRAKSLARTLGSIAAMRPAEEAWETLVVDNGSADDTRAVVGSFAGRLPIRYCVEAKPGVSHARNRAVAESAAEYILWTDDDVIVDGEWLNAYLAAFRQWPDAVLFGGKTLPLFEAKTPAWLDETFELLGGVFAYRDFGDAPLRFTLEGRVIPFGSNYAVHAGEHRKHPFNTDLGPRPGQPIYGEETDLIEAILRGGGIGYWVPGAKVQHCIPPERMTLDYIDRYYQGYGRYLAYSDKNGTAPRMFGAPRWLWRRFIASTLQYWSRRTISRPGAWMEYRVGRAVDRGMLDYYRGGLNPPR